jgi:hypothetical protein
VSTWSRQMDRILVLSQKRLGGQPTSYQRPGYPAFSIVGMPAFVDRLEDPNRGQFYSVHYRVADFAELIKDPDTGELKPRATFTSSVTVTFSGAPASGGYLIFDGVSYTAQATLDDSVANQFWRGGNALAAASNLAAAINATDGYAGTSYSAATIKHPTCLAVFFATTGGAAVVVSYYKAGIIGDSILAEDHASYVSLDSKQFFGGIPLENDLVTIENILYRVSDVPEPDPEGDIQIRLEKKAT